MFEELKAEVAETKRRSNQTEERAAGWEKQVRQQAKEIKALEKIRKVRRVWNIHGSNFIFYHHYFSFWIIEW